MEIENEGQGENEGKNDSMVDRNLLKLECIQFDLLCDRCYFTTMNLKL